MTEISALMQYEGSRSGYRLFSGKGESWGRGGVQGSIYPAPERIQLEQYAEAFNGLARLFQKLPCQRERLGDAELEEVLREVQTEVCTDCPNALVCWGEEYDRKSRMMYEMLYRMEEGNADQQLPGEESCIRAAQLGWMLERKYGDARLTLMWNNRMLEQRMAVGEQISQTAGLLRQMADSFAGMPELEQRLGKKMKRELKSWGITLSSIRVFSCEARKFQVYLSLYACGKDCVSAKTVAEILSDCSKEKMRPAWNCQAAVGTEPAVFHFVPEPAYQVLCGISRITKTGEMVSGDNYTLIQKDSGKVVMSLADGMGSGVNACRESEKVIELLEQFLDAGFPQETAVRMINSCMLLQNRQQMFSTIDLCMIDLYSGSCDLVKYGAASTFIVHENEIEVIDSSEFPMGVMQQSDYESMHRRLQPGSSVIMMTDGVLEALPEEDREQKMVELIGWAATRNAKEYARRLMEKVYLMQKLQARDDMTILVGTIWKR